MSFGNRLKLLREENDLLREDLAAKLNLSYSAISKYETDNRTPDDQTKMIIAKYFNVSLDYLMGASDIKNPYNDNALSKKDEKDIAADLENTLDRLEGAQDGLMFDGEALDDETRELLKISLENSMRLAKQIAKKYTPNKYKK